MRCPYCRYKFYLTKRPWLSKKKGKYIAFQIENLDKEQKINFKEVSKDYSFEYVWDSKGNGKVRCPNCNKITENINIEDCNDEIVALIRGGRSKGKEYITGENSLPDKECIKNIEALLLKELNIELPRTELPRWSGILNPSIYGVKTHGDFLNKRQRLVLIYLIKALKEEYQKLINEYNSDIAKFVIAILSSFIDQCVDWNCRFCMWISQNEQVGRAFCGPGVSMYWDYVESDLVMYGPANLNEKLERVVSGLQSTVKYSNKVEVKHAIAQSLPYKDNFFDAIVTDPPYYDNLYYGVLADFFFSWKRLLMKNIEPELFESEKTNSNRELVSSTFRSGDAFQAHKDYCEELKLAIKEAERVLKNDGVFSFLYGHSSYNAWNAFIKAYRSTNLQITSVQPLSIERKQRPRAMTSEAINTCLVFIARKSKKSKKNISLDEIIVKIKNINEEFGLALINAGWSKEDAGMAVFSNGVALLANSRGIKEDISDLDAMLAIENIVRKKLPEFKLKARKSL